MSKLKQIADSPPLFDTKVEFKFSQELHHGGVQIVTDTMIKSTGMVCLLLLFRGVQLSLRADGAVHPGEGQ